MQEVKLVVDVHQGYTFDIRVFHLPAGYTYAIDVHQPPDETLKIKSGDNVFRDVDNARDAARRRAWSIIDDLVRGAD